MSSPRTAPGGSVGRGTPSAGVGGKVRSWGGGWVVLELPPASVWVVLQQPGGAYLEVLL